ncbi:diguanylate cyclase [Aerophototrophica crusticola]|uniref:diguanylate cyclase n=1 Tax=Aerophototrophica crusticola TaxID=1709002 RepID=A0A858RAN7_9PROT|nr:diguanylate cyclase [Rhodospirillaceae bacterium B3]
MRVLVVDDSRFVREMLQAVLLDLGYEVAVCETAEEAELLASGDWFDIVLVDLNLPGKSGIELCWDLRVKHPPGLQYLVIMTTMTQIATHIEALDGGADDFMPKPIDIGLLRARLRLGERLVRAHKDMHRLAMTDPLSGVLNRRSFFEQAEDALRRRQRTVESLAVVMVDIDHFKRVNDGFGHDMGDEVIRQVAKTLQGAVRQTDCIGRLGGEEFAILFSNTGIDVVSLLAERLRKRIAELALRSEGRLCPVTASFGVSPVLPDEDAIEAALKRADSALYRSKHEGRNRVTVLAA